MSLPRLSDEKLLQSSVDAWPVEGRELIARIHTYEPQVVGRRAGGSDERWRRCPNKK